MDSFQSSRHSIRAQKISSRGLLHSRPTLCSLGEFHDRYISSVLALHSLGPRSLVDFKSGFGFPACKSVDQCDHLYSAAPRYELRYTLLQRPKKENAARFVTPSETIELKDLPELTSSCQSRYRYTAVKNSARKNFTCEGYLILGRAIHWR